MQTQHVDTVIIGAGQAGLSTAYHLRREGVDCLVLDGNARIGDEWRRRYDSLRLFTPAGRSHLDGLPFPGDPWAFPTKDEMADYLELYALTHELPVRLRSRVRRVAADGDGFRVELEEPAEHPITCDAVVVATGTFGERPNLPPFASDLAETVHQVHSSRYHGPDDLPAGPVLVVGASHSGLDIALELAAERETTLVGPVHGSVPLEWGTWRMRRAFPVIEFAFQHILTRRTPMGRKMLGVMRHHGAPQLRVKAHHLAEAGVEWIDDHVVGASTDGLPQLADGRTFEVASVVWATGWRHDHSWLDVPMEVEDGWPVEYRGVVEDVPGLYFCGLAFQYAFSSGEMCGVGRDAAHVADRIARRRAARVPAA